MITEPTLLWQMTPNREPDFVIGAPLNPYMLRWYLVPKNDQFNVYYHRILRDDDERALHDHPWASFSICTKGRLIEVTPDGERMIRPGDCVLRSPDAAHRLKLATGPRGKPEPAETLFITGPKVRDWGFHCPKGWVSWQDFCAVGDAGQVGRGCGEMG